MALPIVFDGRTGTQIDTDINAEFAALVAAIATKLGIDLATEITATKAVPVDADKIVILDSADTDTPKISTRAQFLAGISGSTDLTYTAATRVIASSTGTDATLPLVSSGDAGLAPASGGGTVNFLRSDGTWAAPAGGGAALGLWDYWDEARIGHAGVVSGVFTASAVAAGSNSNSPDAAYFEGYSNLGNLLRSTTAANSGFRYSSAQTTSIIFTGGTGNKFRTQFMWLDSFADKITRAGYIDSFNNVDLTDGAYFEVVGDSTLVAKTAANGTRTTNATTYTLTLGVKYTMDIDVNAAGTEVRFRLYAGTSETAVLDVTNTTNIPSGTARSFGVGLTALTTGSAAINLGMIYSIGVGTPAGFTRARG